MGSNHRGEYPPNWKQIADRVKLEAGHRCVRCGHPGEGAWKSRPGGQPTPCDDLCDLSRHREWIQGCDNLNPDNTRTTQDGRRYFEVQSSKPQRVLTVAHLNDDKADCRWWNLAALCQGCHLQTQGRIDMDRPWALVEHSDWFKPYVAGHYAAKYLGVHLTREQITPHIETLAGIERNYVCTGEWLWIPGQAITVRQPWAHLIAIGKKDIENRRQRLRTLPIRRAIHAGLQIDKQANYRFDGIEATELPRGAIVATATITKSVDQHSSPWFTGPHGWVLEDVRPVKTPIVCTGQQGHWRIPEEHRMTLALDLLQQL